MKILCEISVRHVHISKEHVEILFGKGHQLKFVRELSQPGQFLASERVELVTAKSTIKNVAVLGPERTQTQVEISRTDCFALGLKNVPVRQSGNLVDSPAIILRTEKGEVKIDSGVIVAQRHIHMDTKTAKDNGFKDGQIISVKFGGSRGGTLNNTVVRVHDNFAPAVHIDSDEGNALGFCSGEVEILA
ncbi:MAG: phosphate propanoyltransferase [Firmicutes bacterium]|nr:phosphate propanoyltransferase [Bacillota bacterium]